MTGKIRLLAWIYIVLGAGCLLIGTVTCLGLALSDDRESRALEYIGPMFLMVATFYLLPALVGGIGLLQGKAWGRVLLIVLSSLALLGVPIGTLFGAFALWILLGADANRLFAGGGAAPPSPASGVTYSASEPAAPFLSQQQAGLLMWVVAIGSGFVVMLGTGSRVTGQPDPEWIPMPLFIAAIVLLIGSVSLWVKWFLAQPHTPITAYFLWTNPFDLPKLRRLERERLSRLARLAANPVTRKYVSLIERGESWDDEQIAYSEDRNKLATCVHVQPIERAIRASGIEVILLNGMDVRAKCQIDHAELQRRFALPDTVHYIEAVIDQRSEYDPPSAWINCTVCRSIIDAVHRDVAAPGTPVFPAPGRSP